MIGIIGRNLLKLRDCEHAASRTSLRTEFSSRRASPRLGTRRRNRLAKAHTRGKPLASGRFAAVSARQIAYGALMALTVACSRPEVGIPGATGVPMQARFGADDHLRNLANARPTAGKYPQAPLIDVGGILYGTTNNGGTFRDPKTCYFGCGTVFSITTSGVVKVLHSFGGAEDGKYPAQAGLVDVGGTLYGTTSAGGAFGDGTVFSITTDGVENVLHSFGGQGDGSDPIGGSLLEVRGTLYGTTWSGGTFGSSRFTSVSAPRRTCWLRNGLQHYDERHRESAAQLWERRGRAASLGGPGPLRHRHHALWDDVLWRHSPRHMRWARWGRLRNGLAVELERGSRLRHGLQHYDERHRESAAQLWERSRREVSAGAAPPGARGALRHDERGWLRCQSGNRLRHHDGRRGEYSLPVCYRRADRLMQPLPPPVSSTSRERFTARAITAASCQEGTVYSVTTAGVEKVLHGFCNGINDGSTPWAAQLALTLPHWRECLRPIAARLAQTFRESLVNKGAPPHTLAAKSGNKRRNAPGPERSPLLATPRRASQPRPYATRAWRTPTVEARPANPVACALCGEPVLKRRRHHCEACMPKARREHGLRAIAAARMALAVQTVAGNDPRRSADVNRARGEAISDAHGRNRRWAREHPGQRDEAWFKRVIVPKLDAFTLKVIAAATGLSLAACSRVRSGAKVPHPRHWDRLLALVEAGN